MRFKSDENVSRGDERIKINSFKRNALTR